MMLPGEIRAHQFHVHIHIHTYICIHTYTYLNIIVTLSRIAYLNKIWPNWGTPRSSLVLGAPHIPSTQRRRTPSDIPDTTLPWNDLLGYKPLGQWELV